MAWYNGKFSCGCEGRVNVIGPGRDREWKIERAFANKCEECNRKDFLENLEKEKKEAAEKAKEMELPELTGTEKQVSWANTIRQKMIELIQEKKCIYIDDKSELLRLSDKKDSLHMRRIGGKKIESSKVIDIIINNCTEARFYIDNRDFGYCLGEELYKIIKKNKENKTENKIEKEIEKEIQEELTAYPENCETSVSDKVILTIKDNKIIAKYTKCDEFKEIIKENGFSWNWENYTWEKEINFKNGTIEDRCAEVGNALLNAGLPVKFDTIDIKEKSISADFEEEVTRWIVLFKTGEFGIWFKERNDKLYNAARSIKSSKWNNPYVQIKSDYYKEIIDFAEAYDFKIHDSVKEKINEMKENEKKIKKVSPKKKTKKELKDGPESILDSNTDILEDLKDV
jgi:hypothetical protein